MADDRHGVGVLLPAAVLERLPMLRKDHITSFFDFGMSYEPSALSGTKENADGTERSNQQGLRPVGDAEPTPVVVVLTEATLYVASFPHATKPVNSVSLKAISGISRAHEHVSLRCSTCPNVELSLPKADTFVIHLIDTQDRRMNRALHLAAGLDGGAGASPEGVAAVGAAASPNRGVNFAENVAGDQVTQKAAKSLRDHQAHVMDGAGAEDSSEIHMGVFRFGKTSTRTERPLREFDEGSDASSVQTVDHEVVEEDIAENLVDLPPVVVDSTSLFRRLWYFFLQYDRSKLRMIDTIIAQHKGLEATLIRELETKYGPEPNKMRWETRDQIAHQREINLQLKAQLARAKDELLLLGHEQTHAKQALDRVLSKKEIVLQQLEVGGGSLYQGESGIGGPNAVQRVRNQADNVLSLLRVGHAGGESPMTNNAQGLNGGTKLEYYFPAPIFFFDFVMEQVKLVRGGSAHPNCVLCETSDRNVDPAKQLQLRSVVVNRHLLGVWARQFSDHSVAVKLDSTRWQFIPSYQHWTAQ